LNNVKQGAASHCKWRYDLDRKSMLQKTQDKSHYYYVQVQQLQKQCPPHACLRAEAASTATRRLLYKKRLLAQKKHQRVVTRTVRFHVTLYSPFAT
jgi:hypothetical protein